MIQKDTQRTLADQLFHPEKQNTRTAAFLAKMETVIDWKPLVRIANSIKVEAKKAVAPDITPP